MEQQENCLPRLAGMSETKLAIFTVAVDLFSAKGYSTVGIRDIAKAVGIKSSSIYNHFESKDAIAEQMYRLVFECYYDRMPPLESVLERIPGLSPEEALEQLLPPCEGPDVYEIINKITTIAMDEKNNDYRARDLISEMYNRTKDRLAAVLDKMSALGLIEPLKIDLFTTIFVSFSLSPTSFTGREKTLPFDIWRDGRRMLFTLVRKNNPLS